MRELVHCMPPGAGYQVWEPSPQILEAVTTALINKRQAPESVVVTPPPVEARAQSLRLQQGRHRMALHPLLEAGGHPIRRLQDVGRGV